MRSLAALAALLTIAAAPIPQWPYPGLGTQPDPPAPSIARLPNSLVTFPQADLGSMARAIDWFPQSHPPAPDAVLRAHNGAAPCGYCHLPDGSGRPENASLRGSPPDYIAAQVHAFATGARRPAADFPPSSYMATVARAVTAADLAAAAAYFSRLAPQSHTTVIEAATIPAATPWHFVYRFDPTHQEPIGQRIVEGPKDPDRFELRDPETSYVAYVPPGAIARGDAIAHAGTACTTCHGPTLAGIAGASPTYLARQLFAFRGRTRNDPDAAPMQAVAAHLTDAQIIAVAAYVASRPAWTR